MAVVYYNLITKNLKSIEDVPERWGAEVQALLDGDAA